VAAAASSSLRPSSLASRRALAGRVVVGVAPKPLLRRRVGVRAFAFAFAFRPSVRACVGLSRRLPLFGCASLHTRARVDAVRAHCLVRRDREDDEDDDEEDDEIVERTAIGWMDGWIDARRVTTKKRASEESWWKD